MLSSYTWSPLRLIATTYYFFHSKTDQPTLSLDDNTMIKAKGFFLVFLLI